MVKKYYNERLGKLIQAYIGHRPGASLESAVKLSQKLPLSDSTCFSIINGLIRGNVLGNFDSISKDSRLSSKDHAIRLSHYLNILEIPKIHEIINLSKKSFRNDFIYPPVQGFPYTKGAKRLIAKI